MKWVPIQVVTAFHDRQISRHGGASGVRDQSLLEAACARPTNKHSYGEENVFALAAAYAYGIAKAHAFVDGNKRTAFVTAVAFLRMNGFAFLPDQVSGVVAVENLAQDLTPEAEFADWLRQGSTAL